MVTRYLMLGIEALGPEAALAVPALVKKLEDRDSSVRYQAVLTLRRIGPGTEHAVLAMVQILKDPDDQVRAQAAHALREAVFAPPEIAAVAREAIPALKDALDDRSPRVQGAAREALWWLRQSGRR